MSDEEADRFLESMTALNAQLEQAGAALARALQPVWDALMELCRAVIETVGAWLSDVLECLRETYVAAQRTTFCQRLICWHVPAWLAVWLAAWWPESWLPPPDWYIPI